ncbi:MAG: glycosyltransferase family 4 protein [Bacillota bacterium]
MKILLAPTVPGWAFDHRAKDLLSLHIKGIKFELKYLREIKNKDQFSYDLIYPMTLDGAKILNKEAGIPLNMMAAGITSLRSIEKYRIDVQKFDPKFIRLSKKLRGLNTASDEIVDLFTNQCKVYKTRVGINESLFKPDKKKKENKTFQVGWVGRIDKPEHRELKGYDLVICALKDLDVKLDIRTFKENYVPRRKMVEFYQNLDCFICSSKSEHIPLPVLEAAACGVPIITTKVGIVPELIRHKKNGIVVSRNSEKIKQAVQYLMNNERERNAISDNIRKTIVDKWTWDKCKTDWEIFFKKAGKEG